ncbi:MAG: Cell division protein FtsK, partial [Myxococcaceae bacterium]|nr:Cell division protein FtsK [Myxococcaceae bacterium]
MLPLFAPRRAGSMADAPANTRQATVLGPGATTRSGHGRPHEVAALLLWTLAVFLILALASFEGDPAAGTNTGPSWVGPVGEWCAKSLVGVVGVIAWALPLEAMLLGIPLVRGKKSLITPARFAGDLLIVLNAAAMVQVGWAGKTSFGGYASSGVVGELFGELLRSLFSTIGSFLVGFACLGLILIGRASFSFIALMRFLARFTEKGARGTAAGAKSVAEAWKTARQIEQEKREKDRLAGLPNINELASDDEATIAVLPDEDPLDLSVGIAEALTDEEPAPASKRRPRKKKEKPPVEDKAPEPEPEPVTEPDPEEAEEEEEAAEPEPEEPKASKRVRVKIPKTGPVIIDTSAALEKEAPTKAEMKEKIVPAIGKGFRLPPIDFLVAAKVDPTLFID